MSAPTIISCEQGTPEWYQARMGIPTASEFATIMANGRSGGPSVGRRTYMLKLAGELITGELQEGFVNAHMERGKVMEAEARDLYAFTHDVEPELVGFIRADAAGCSPDSLIGDRGLLEIKTKLPHILAEVLLKDDVPSEHKAQLQGNLWVSQRDWIDLVCYWPKMPQFVKRVRRDEVYIRTLAEAVDRFNDELSETVERLRSIGAAA